MTWPTARMLDGLKSGWTNPRHERLVRAKQWGELPKLSELGHPAIAICQGYDPAALSGQYSIHQESTKRAGYPVTEARDKAVGTGWRTAIVKHLDEYWAVHADAHDAFHKSSPAQFKRHKANMLPTRDDLDVKKLILAKQADAHAFAEWRADLVRATLSAFASAWGDAPTYSASVTLPEPPANHLPEGVNSVGAIIDIELLRDSTDIDDADDEADDMLVEIVLTLGPGAHVSNPISDAILNTVLPTIAPVEDRWTRNSNYKKVGGQLECDAQLTFAEVEQILFAVEVEGELIEGVPETQPTLVAHYFSAAAIVDSVVNKTAMRSACGAWIVSSQDPAGMPVCTHCVEELPDISVVRDILRARIRGEMS